MNKKEGMEIVSIEEVNKHEYSVQYLCDLEHDRKIVSEKKAKFFADILGYSVEQFMI